MKDGVGYSDTEQLIRSLEEDSRPESRRRVVSRLFSQQRELAESDSGKRDPLGFPWDENEVNYDSAWSAACKQVLALKGRDLAADCNGDSALAELLDSAPSRRRLKICQDSRFQSWSLCEALLTAARKACFDQPSEALELSELAVTVAAELTAENRTSALLADLKAEAWAVLGNARRVSSDLRGAEKAFELAESLLERVRRNL